LSILVIVNRFEKIYYKLDLCTRQFMQTADVTDMSVCACVNSHFILCMQAAQLLADKASEGVTCGWAAC